ncbi:GAP family protein [Sporosarcina obsidiansis]|uniref:GAP family protein n=1 Tax=Sporosarcina obsidiansis TaxID=2660748 RepID=UPI00129B5D69|nr:GAP family protein [Sporosarcina obsidiansis]
MSNELVLLIGGMALLDMLSPATLAVTIYLLLTNPKKLTAHLLVYLSTVAGFYFLVGVSLMLGLDFLLDHMTNVLKNKLVSWAAFTMGILLFFGSFYTPKKQKKTQKLAPQFTSTSPMIALGFTTSLIEVGTAFPYFAAIGIMAASHLAWMEWPLLLVGYNLIMITPSLLVYVAYQLLGKRIHSSLEKLRDKIEGQTGSALSWIMCIVGLMLIFNSLDYL